MAKRYVKKNFVDKGMVADFAIHEKEGNPHMHVMCTVRGFNKNGTWAKMEKKVYARDKNGDKIPKIDSKTGMQKVRVRKGKGEEKLWKRVTVKSNDWNSREQLISWRENWAKTCNEYLEEKDKITHLSFEDQGIERVPTIHEGYAARGMEDREELSDRVSENNEIQELNDFFDDDKDDDFFNFGKNTSSNSSKNNNPFSNFGYGGYNYGNYGFNNNGFGYNNYGYNYNYYWNDNWYKTICC